MSGGVCKNLGWSEGGGALLFSVGALLKPAKKHFEVAFRSGFRLSEVAFKKQI